MNINEYDLRQLKIMVHKINAYKTGKLHIHDLIYDLEALLNVLIEIDEEWKQYFKGYWWDLEQCHAFALYEGNRSFNDDDELIIMKAIQNLTKMIEKKMRWNKDFE